jgi:hypothetical protein
MAMDRLHLALLPIQLAYSWWAVYICDSPADYHTYMAWAAAGLMAQKYQINMDDAFWGILAAMELEDSCRKQAAYHYLYHGYD